mmetsp:Transcript_27289/g.35397  ORF Transcript_27289/g.35397 Transcript_27289/m.35397 type:complete len:220 (+) Transcript_27289:131-790(+)
MPFSDNLAQNLLGRILKGIRNGAIYGTKIRLPHAMVMVFLFKQGSFMTKLKAVLKLTFEHAKNLAMMVGIYKTSREVLRILQGRTQEWHALVSGGLGGYFVFSKHTSVTFQIVLYLASRVLVALAGVAAKKSQLPVIRHLAEDPKTRAYPIFASVVWALVMWLFERDPDMLHPSLRSSMDFLYKESNDISTVHDFLPNKQVLLTCFLYSILISSNDESP